MTTDDISDVLKVTSQAFTGGEGWSKSTLNAELINHLAHCFVALKNNKICGFANIWIIAGEANINSITISPNFRRQGLGSFLIENIIEYCKKNNTTIVTLEVRESNIAAQNLYKKHNFNIDGERKKYYSDGETAILMSNKNI